MLHGEEIEELLAALKDAYRSRDDLALMVKFKLGVNLAQISAMGKLEYVLFELVEWAQSSSKEEELVRGALLARPTNRKLQRFCSAYFATEDFERIVRPKEPKWFIDGVKWRQQWAAAERAVCRIEYDGEAIGTGFLVAEDLLITTHHVVFDASRPTDTSNLLFHFDFRTLNDSTLEGEHCSPAKIDWLVHESDREELDYAVIRLDRKIGGETPVSATPNKPRGWLRPRAYQFKGNETLLIVQHAEGKPISSAFGTHISSSGAFAHYSVNTSMGSSGSPVLLNDWSVVALHRGSREKTQNTGVLFSKILANLPAGIVS